VKFWNTQVGRWVEGDVSLNPDLDRWRASYAGRGDGAVDLSVFPEPYIGPLAGEQSPALVVLGLNPGAPAPLFQGSDGIYTRQIRLTSYGAWAATGPYSDPDWVSLNGPNRYQQSRLTFARRLHQDPDIQASQVLDMELCPFHSKRVTAPITPPPDIVARFILDPIAELGVPFVFAFGKPWLTAATALGLGEGSTLTAAWTTPSREARSYPLNNNQSLIVMNQHGYAGPPGAADTEALRHAIGR
jgi:hypothetical protein